LRFSRTLLIFFIFIFNPSLYYYHFYLLKPLGPQFSSAQLREKCTPNTVTFNSLITALAQGAQWERASEVVDLMRSHGCTPDVVTYTALISSLEKGGQWRRALGAYERMRRQGLRGDAIVFNAIIDALWATGVVWAQRRALALFKGAVEDGHFQQGRLVPGLARAEVNLHAMTAGVAMLSLYAWLVSLRQLAAMHGADAIPGRLVLVADRGRGAKEQGNLVVKEAVLAAMVNWEAPFRWGSFRFFWKKLLITFLFSLLFSSSSVCFYTLFFRLSLKTTLTLIMCNIPFPTMQACL
jgi:pentatricopeptide repeat protein